MTCSYSLARSSSDCKWHSMEKLALNFPKPARFALRAFSFPTPMKLQRLKTELPTLNTRKLPVLQAKAGTTPRLRGEAWMKIRRRVLIAGGHACVDCGRVHASNQIDHQIPLEQGGTDDESNLRIRCVECHEAKTSRENRARLKG